MYKAFENEARKIISKMTLGEKIGQLHQISITPYCNDMDKLRQMIREGRVGSLILAASATAGNDPQGHINIDAYNELQKIAVEESRLGIPMIFGIDVIHGHMCLGRNIKCRERMLKEKLIDEKTKLVLNHFSHNWSNSVYTDFLPMAAEKGFEVSYDGMEIDF